MDQKRVEHHSIGRDEIDVHRQGDPAAPALWYEHGFTSSGAEGPVALEGAEELGFQIIAPTRPGYGHSSPRVEKTLKKITEAELRLMDRLGVREVYTVGSSAGAKHALALADREPGRITGVSILSPLPPYEDRKARFALPSAMRIGMTAISTLPDVMHWFLVWAANHRVRAAQRDPEQEFRTFMQILPPADQAELAKPEVFAKFVAIVRDWSAPGTAHGMIGDMQRSVAPWGFDPKDITKDIQIIHGGLDPVVPLAAGRTFNRPGAELIVHPERGHAMVAYSDVSQQVLSQAKKLLGR